MRRFRGYRLAHLACGVALAVSSGATSVLAGDGWQLTLEAEPLPRLMIGEAPSLNDLQIARARTQADTKTVKNGKVQGETSLIEKGRVLRRAARAHWLQLNLEYQAFLANGGGSEQRMLALAVRDHYRALSDILWFVPEAAEQLPASEQSPSLMAAGENMVEWETARQFMEVIYDDVRPQLPTEAVPAGTIVRRAYFHLISPSRDSADANDPNVKIQDAYRKAFAGLQQLGKEAAAGKVQAAVVMRRFYGSNPKQAYQDFDTSGIENADFEAKAQQKVRLAEERKLLFAGEEPLRDRIHELVQEVTTGVPSPGIVENYRVLNVTIDSATKTQSETNRGVGWSGLLSMFDAKPDIHYPGDLVPNATGIAGIIHRIDVAYGFLRSPVNQDEAKLGVEVTAPGSTANDLARFVVPLRNAMELANKKSTDPGGLLDSIRAWVKNQPSGNDELSRTVVSLDDLIEYDGREDGGNRPAKRVSRRWFEELQGAGGAGHSLAFSSTRSGDSLRGDPNPGSVIPEISLALNARPTNADQLIRSLAGSGVVASGVTYSHETPPPSPVIAASAAGAPNAGPALQHESVVNIERDRFGERLLSLPLTNRQGMVLLNKAKLIDHLETIWKAYIPQKTTRFRIQRHANDWLKRELKGTEFYDLIDGVSSGNPTNTPSGGQPQ